MSSKNILRYRNLSIGRGFLFQQDERDQRFPVFHRHIPALLYNFLRLAPIFCIFIFFRMPSPYAVRRMPCAESHFPIPFPFCLQFPSRFYFKLPEIIAITVLRTFRQTYKTVNTDIYCQFIRQNLSNLPKVYVLYISII
ncbi:hypothetical protein D1BOALGB6SA_2176 [Olavius sp. associated proteobacterium Delta 1]|nr:hypothetical protein D1BOALGB6SA_2176 [Olavius sp. associated proteobacterium Delta 1]